MKQQLQGIALILFGFMLILFSVIDPWIPIIEGPTDKIFLWSGLLFGIWGVFHAFEKDIFAKFREK